LQESTANVDEWKRQLQSYKEENQRLKTRYLDAEVAKGKLVMNHLMPIDANKLIIILKKLKNILLIIFRGIRSCFRIKK